MLVIARNKNEIRKKFPKLKMLSLLLINDMKISNGNPSQIKYMFV